MSPVVINGRSLGVQNNGVFTEINTDPIVLGRLWPEAALTWMAMRAAFVADGGNPDHFVPGGPASSARSIAQQRFFYAHRPPAAAIPGSSNHGYGIAVDCPFADAQVWLMRNCHRYGWSHDEGASVGEAWHFRLVGAPPSLLRKLRLDPLKGYTAAERRWIKELDHLVKTRSNAHRQSVLRRVMTEQRKRIWKLSQPIHAGGDGRGWTKLRKRRYKSLKSRTV